MSASTLARRLSRQRSPRTAELRRFALIGAVMAALLSLNVLVGRGQTHPGIIIASFLATTLATATPLTLGALSGLMCERAGVVNIAIEGLMLAAAFTGWIASTYFKAAGLPDLASLAAGVGVAMLTGGLLACLHACLSVTFKVDQVISGTVINIMAIGFTGYFRQTIVLQGLTLASAGVLPVMRLPLLADLPVIGRVFHQQPIALVTIALVLLVHIVLFHTVWGLHTRAVGEHPRAADTVGISVARMRYANVVAGGFIAGLGGAYFTLESVPSFQPMMTNGRGFIALAAVIFGNWTPFGAWAATLLFGAAQALQINLQFYTAAIPAGLHFLKASQIVGMLPYLLTMLALSGIMGRSTPPAADGQPYEP